MRDPFDPTPEPWVAAFFISLVLLALAVGGIFGVSYRATLAASIEASR